MGFTGTRFVGGLIGTRFDGGSSGDGFAGNLFDGGASGDGFAGSPVDGESSIPGNGLRMLGPRGIERPGGPESANSGSSGVAGRGGRSVGERRGIRSGSLRGICCCWLRGMRFESFPEPLFKLPLFKRLIVAGPLPLLGCFMIEFDCLKFEFVTIPPPLSFCRRSEPRRFEAARFPEIFDDGPLRARALLNAGKLGLLADG